MPHQNSIRTANPRDAPEIARLLHAFNTEFDDPTPGAAALERRCRSLLAEGAITVLLAERPPVGLALLRFRPALWVDSDHALDAYLEELYVEPERRGQGLGRALLDVALRVAREAGAVHFELVTSTDDTAAMSLYESAGMSNRESRPDGPTMLYYERDL